jgi:hypothetical protein
MSDPRRFEFAFDPRYRIPARLVGVHPGSAWVEVRDDVVEARFGPWWVQTERTNVVGVGRSGPYAIAKTIGPAHLSAADRGLTFATNAQEGVCLSFERPVTGMDPFGLLKHPGLTVTVADPEGLVVALLDGGVKRTDRDFREEQQAALDELHTMTASQLRSVAREQGVDHAASASKAELVTLLEERLGTRLVDELPS